MARKARLVAQQLPPNHLRDTLMLGVVAVEAVIARLERRQTTLDDGDVAELLDEVERLNRILKGESVPYRIWH